MWEMNGKASQTKVIPRYSKVGTASGMYFSKPSALALVVIQKKTEIVLIHNTKIHVWVTNTHTDYEMALCLTTAIFT